MKNDNTMCRLNSEISMELSPEEVEMFAGRLVNRTDVWYRQHSRGYFAQSSGRCDFEPVSSELIQKVFAGTISCALPAFDADGMCKWAAWDCDRESQLLDVVERRLCDHLLNPLREGRREGRSGHCWLFFSEPIPANEVRLFDSWLREDLGIREDDLEFFPRQYHPGKFGTPLRMPLSINLKPEAQGGRGWFDGIEQDVITQVRWFLQQPATDSAIVRKFVSSLKKPTTTSPKGYTLKRTHAVRKIFWFSIWDYVHESDCKRVGGEFATQCPVCAKEGHDMHRDNLRILSDDSFICMFGSPGRTHHRIQVAETFAGIR